jgi:hypothetical protein
MSRGRDGFPRQVLLRDGKRTFGAGVTARDVGLVSGRVRNGKTDLRGGCECAGAEMVFRGRFTG